MFEVLAKVLVERRILNATTELEITYDGVDMGGRKVTSIATFNIKDVEESNGRLVFNLVSTVDGKHHKAHSDQIINIDGMDPLRFAAVYGIKANGGNAAQQRKRGRKPKPKPEQVDVKDNKLARFPNIIIKERTSA